MASLARLALTLKPGGTVPELKAMPLPQARAALKKFPDIADPGADRILLFGGISPVAAVPSNCPHVLVRIRLGRERENYGMTCREAQEMIAAEVPAKFDARVRAYLVEMPWPAALQTLEAEMQRLSRGPFLCVLWR